MAKRTYDPVKRRAYYLRLREENPQKLRTWAHRTALKQQLELVGTTKEEYDTALERQKGKCAICNEAPQYGRRLSVDHDHTVGGFRGLLCTHCNLAIGHLFDNLEYLVKAAEYVRAHRASKK